METSLYNHLKNVNPNWTSKSRIYGEAVESWVEKNIQCDCLGSYIIQKANYKSIDGICNNCQKKIQIKASKNILKPNKSISVSYLLLISLLERSNIDPK